MRKRASFSGLFLLELTISILIFAIAAAVCISFFAKAHTLTRNASQLQEATTQTGNYAELVLASDTYEELLRNTRALYPDAEISEVPTQIRISFDENFVPTGEVGPYTLLAQIDTDAYLLHADLDFSAESGSLYQLALDHALQPVESEVAP